MNFYDNADLFNNLLDKTSRKLGIRNKLIEKDYFIYILLKEIAKRIPGIIFKGGTCLSKCFKIVDRFSEDIDLSLDVNHFTQTNKRFANKEIIAICDDLKFEIANRDSVINHSHASFNCYEIKYPVSKSNNEDTLEYTIKVELVFIQKPFPTIEKEVSSYIYDFVKITNDSCLGEYDEDPFKINVQSLERTFIDKVFAICDYYLRDEAKRNSRHIYDLYKLFPIIDRTNLNNLINEVRALRQKNARSISAYQSYDINVLLHEVIKTKFYALDYEKVTYPLLIKKVKYEETIKTLYEIINLKIF